MLTGIKTLLVQFWIPITLTVIGLTAAFVLITWNLGSKPAALNSDEVTTRQSSLVINNIAANPINAPYKLLEHLAIKIKPLSISASRSISVAFGIFAAILFFGIVRFWFDAKIATLGTILFITSTWFLNTARLATPNVLQFVILVLLALGLWFKHTFKRNIFVVVASILLGIAMYIPGFVWFFVISIVWKHKTIRRELKYINRPVKVIAPILLIIVILPLAYAIFKTPHLGYTILGFPSTIPSPLSLLKNLYQIPATLFFHAPYNPTHWVGSLPALDVFADAMFILGVYTLWNYRELDRVRLLSALFGISMILIALGGPITLTIIIPLVYIIIASGISYMFESWRKVFPHNPLAHAMSTTLVIVAIFFSCLYQGQRYFVAWPNSRATQSIFDHKINNFDTIYK